MAIETEMFRLLFLCHERVNLMELSMREKELLISVCGLSIYLQLPALTSVPVMPEAEQMQKSVKYSPLNPEQIRHEYR